MTPDLDAIVELRKAAEDNDRMTFYEACYAFDFAALQSRLAVLEGALEIIAATPEKAPDAIGVTARNIARSALRDGAPLIYTSRLTPDPDSEEDYKP